MRAGSLTMNFILFIIYALSRIAATGLKRRNAMAKNVFEVTDQNFNQEVSQATVPVLVDFWAPWCGPCLAIAPHVEAIADQFAGKIKVGKLNVDDQQSTAGQFGIRSIPTLLLFKDGQPVDQLIGSVSKAKLEEFVNRHLG